MILAAFHITTIRHTKTMEFTNSKLISEGMLRFTQESSITYSNRCGQEFSELRGNSQITPRSTKKQSHRGSAIINLKFCKAGSNRPNSVYQSNIALHSVRFDKLSE